jgi:hypothetical protein
VDASAKASRSFVRRWLEAEFAAIPADDPGRPEAEAGLVEWQYLGWMLTPRGVSIFDDGPH